MAHTCFLKMQSYSACCLKLYLTFKHGVLRFFSFCDVSTPNWPACFCCTTLVSPDYPLKSGGLKLLVCPHVLQLVAPLYV